MENYKLRADEVVLFKGPVSFRDTLEPAEIIFTNLNLIVINKNKNMFEKQEETDVLTAVEVYPVDSIKIYEGAPQVKTKDTTVEIYLLEKELAFRFESKKSLNQFCEAVTKLLTGTDATHRNAQKVKDTIALVDDTLGINSVQVVGDVLKNGVTKGLSGALGKIGNLFKTKK